MRPCPLARLPASTDSLTKHRDDELFCPQMMFFLDISLQVCLLYVFCSASSFVRVSQTAQRASGPRLACEPKSGGQSFRDHSLSLNRLITCFSFLEHSPRVQTIGHCSLLVLQEPVRNNRGLPSHSTQSESTNAGCAYCVTPSRLAIRILHLYPALSDYFTPRRPRLSHRRVREQMS